MRPGLNIPAMLQSTGMLFTIFRMIEVVAFHLKQLSLLVSII